ncbi:MAG: T9SS C-terminal target domain-containing protein [Bacteroidetes bacterium]|nr:MAG: T9SS C-terminal target domain-containing protein [Bacteroidota bacterium]TAG90033.1 MAG: T9SS C-terminal target domain-containing protein [Bacteroidota bacterium]
MFIYFTNSFSPQTFNIILSQTQKIMSLLFLKKNLFLSFICLFSLIQLKAQTWNVAAGTTDWNTATNWSPNALPTAASNVTITNVAQQPTIPTASNITITSLTINVGATLTIDAGATLTITNTADVLGTIVNNGTLTITNELGITGTFTNNGTLTANSTLLVNAGGTLNVNTGAVFSVITSLTNNGTMTTAIALNIPTIINGGTMNVNSSLTTTNLTNTNVLTVANVSNITTLNNNGGTFTSNGNLNVSGIFTNASGATTVIATGQTFTPTNDVICNGTITNNGTTALIGTNTQTFSGSGTANLGTLNFSKSASTWNINACNVNITNAMTIPAGVTLSVFSSGSLSMVGNFTNNGIFIGNVSTVSFTGNIINNTMSFSANVGSTLRYIGTTNTTVLVTGTNVSAVQFYNLTIAKTASASVTMDISRTITNNLTVNSGATLLMTTGLTLNVGNDFANNGTFTGNNTTINVSNSLSNGGTFTTGIGAINVSGNFVNSAGTFTATANNVMTLLKDFTNNATFTANVPSTVSFEGNLTQNIFGSSNTTFNILNITNKPTNTTLSIGTTAQVTINNNPFVIPATITLNIATSMTLNITNAVTNNGIFNTTNTGTATVNISNNIINNNTITLNVNAGTTNFNVLNGGNFTNTTTGIINHNQGTTSFGLTGSFLQNGAFNNVVATNRTFSFVFSNVSFANTNVTIDGTGTSTSGGVNITTGLLFSNIQVSTNTKVLTIMKPITMYGNLTIDINTFFILNAGTNNQITYANNTTATITDNGTFTPKTSTVAFIGSAQVTITGTSQVAVPIATPTAFATNFYNLIMNTVPPTGTNQPVGITLAASKIITITNNVDLLMGRMTSNSSANSAINNAQTRTIMFSGCTYTGGNSNNSYIDGLLQRNASAVEITAGVVFPIGKNNRIGRMRLNKATSSPASAGSYWGEYFGTNDFDSDMVPGTPTFSSVSDREYWRIQQLGGNAYVAITLYWNDTSTDGIATNNGSISGLNGPLSSSTDITRLGIARFQVDFGLGTPPFTELGWEASSLNQVSGGVTALAATTGAKNTRGTITSTISSGYQFNSLLNNPIPELYEFFCIGSFEDNPDWQIVSWVGSSTGTMQERTSWMNKNNWSPARVPTIRSNVVILGDCPSYPDLDPANVKDVSNPDVVNPSPAVVVYNRGAGNSVPAASNAMPPAIRSLTLARFLLPTDLAIANTLPTLRIRNGATLAVRERRSAGTASVTNTIDSQTNQGTGTGISVGETRNSGTITIDAGGRFLTDNTFSNNEQGAVINNGTMLVATRTSTNSNNGLINGSTNALTPKASIVNNAVLNVGTYNYTDITTLIQTTGSTMNDRNIVNQWNSSIVNSLTGTMLANNITNGTQGSDNNTCFITNAGTITNIASVTNARGALITNNGNWTTGISPSTAGDIINNNSAQIINNGTWNNFNDVINSSTAQITNTSVWNITRDFTNSSTSATAVNTTAGTMNVGRNLAHSAGTFTNSVNVNVTGTTAMSATSVFNNQAAGNYNATGTITNSGTSNINNIGLIRFQADLVHNSSNVMVGAGTLRPYGNATQNLNSNLEGSATAWTTTQSLDLSIKPANTILNWNASATFVNNVIVPVDVTLNTANDLRFPTIAGSLTINGTVNLGTHATATRSFFLRGDLVNNNILTANTGSVVTFSGATNTITSGTTLVNNLVNLVVNKTSGATGQLQNTLNLSGNLTNQAGLQLNTSSLTNLSGNFINNNNVVAQTNSTLIFVGTTNSNISGTTSPTLHHLTLNKTTGNLNLSVATNYNGLLTMTKGLLNTTATNLLIANAGAMASAGNDNSYVVGPMRKILATTEAGMTFTFPSGKGTKWARIAIRNLSAITNNDFFTAEYFANGWGNYAFASSPTPVLVRVSTREYWQLDRNLGGTTTAQVEIFWEDNIYSGINEIINDDLKVARWNGTGWENRGGNPTTITGTILKGSIYTNTQQSNFSPWAFGSISNIGNPLPTDLLSFEGKSNQNQTTTLNWKTWNEINTKTFEIEKSNNALDFQTLTALEPKGGMNQIKNYELIDYQPFSPVTYYRLKIIDNDNSFKYSQIIAVNVEKLDKIQIKNVYPNPFQENINVEFDMAENQNYQISIVDMQGKNVFTDTKNTGNTSYQKLSFDLSHLSQGNYIIKISNGKNMVAEKIIKIN